MLSNGQYPTGVPFFAVCSGFSEDSKVDDVEGHESEGETGKGAGENDADDGDDYLPPLCHVCRRSKATGITCRDGRTLR